MRIALGSDLHLEAGTLYYQPTKCDVLVLAGDVLIAQDLYKSQRQDKPSDRDLVGNTVHSRARRYREFLDRVSDDFEQIVVICGNHEHYHGIWERTHEVLRHEYNYYSNIHFLENDVWVYNDVRFCGTTLWTDFDNNNPITRYHCRQVMNDYQVIRTGENYWRINTDHTYDAHQRAMTWLNRVAKHPDTVVVTHMAPHPKSIHQKYGGDIANASYCTNLDNWIHDHPNVKLWLHGHTHHPFDYQVYNTRVVCNPRGYEGYDAPETYQFKVITL